VSEKPSVPKTGLSSYVAEWLWAHLQNWVSQGIISPEQQAAIKSLYLWPPISGQAAEPAKPFNLILLLEILGALLIGLGVIAFVAFNWPRLSPHTKTILVLLLLTGVHAAGFWLSTQKSTHLAGQALVFLGNLIFGAGIWLVAQIYHLPVNFPQGMLLWAVGVVPMVFLYKSELDYFLALALFAVWTFNLAWGEQIPQPVFLPVFLGLLIPLAYYLRSQLGLLVCLGLGAAWLYLNAFLGWGESALSVFLLLPLAGYGLLLLALSLAHAFRTAGQPYAGIYRVIGLLIVSLLLVMQPFYSVLFPGHDHLLLGSLPWTYWAGTGGLFGAAVGVYLKVLQKQAGAGNWLQSLFPYLLVVSVYWLLLPNIGFSVLPSLLGVALVAWAGWRTKGSWAGVYVALALAAVWVCTLYALWEKPWWIMVLLLLYGAFIYMHGWVLRKHARAEAGRACQVAGLLGYLTVAFIMTFQVFNHRVWTGAGAWPRVYDFWIIAALLFAGVVGSAWAAWPFSRQAASRGMLLEDKAILFLLGCGPLAVLGVLKSTELQNWFTFLANAVLLLFLVLLLVTGYRRRETYLKALALVFISLVVVCRFFEMDWNLMHKALLLVSTGLVIMLVGMFFEKNKERIAILD